MEDLKIVANDLREICKIGSFIMFVPLIVTIFFLIKQGNSDSLHILKKFAAFIIPSIALHLMYLGLGRIRSETQPRTKHRMITVSLAWLIIALIGSLPYIINGTLDPLSSVFESMSGWTTTGMTMISAPEEFDMDVIFYRSFTQWVGGVGIIVLALVVFMRKGTFAMDYYASEVGEQRIKPRLKGTIKETWKIYTVYTLACIVLLYVLGVEPFDAIVHALSALSTGGFSSHADSVGYYNNHANGLLIQLTLIVFMIIGAISFLLHFRLFEGKYKTMFNNVELRYMVWILSTATLITFLLLHTSNPEDPMKTFMDSLFHMVAAMTCTGFSTVDLRAWSDLPQSIVIVLMYIGGLYGSTAGGIKILRLVLIVQVIMHSIKRLLLPKTAVLRMKIEGKQVEGNEIIYVFALCSVYLLVSVVGAGFLMYSGYGGIQSMFLSFSAMGNTGLTAVSNDLWFTMPWTDKIVLTLLMWIGRLEIFPVLVLFSSLIYRGKQIRRDT
ncbi:MAG: TrkH family potassium uptake protein [Candidatus Altiarchaeota archaeon]|nr:TrkH family potassium uptake protein [Candidatus Altiarchaeota archaeon]